MDDEIAALRRNLSSRPRPVGWPDRRARMDEVTTLDPPPADVVYTSADLGGVPAEGSLASGSDAGRALLYLHGGGYCSGSIASHRGMVGRVGAAAGIRTLAPAFRLAPEHPFPAALDDALACYRALRETLPAAAIAIGGDSAGGGLTLAVLTRLRDTGEDLPACAWLVSPWVDLEMTGETMRTKDANDPLIHRDYLASLAAAYLDGHDPRDPLVSPLHADLAGLPPMLVQVGSSETLLDDAVRIARRLGEAEVRVDLEIWPRMIHAWHIWAPRLADGRRATATAAAFLNGHLGPAGASAV